MRQPTSDSTAPHGEVVRREPVERGPGASHSASGGRWRWVGAAGLIAGLGVVAIHDPNQSGSYGLCPLNALTGLDCPFCGGLRGTHALLNGDISRALDHNLLLPVFLGGLVALVVLAWRQSPLLQRDGTSSGRSRPRITQIVVWGFVAATVVFWVLRNLPYFPYLDARA